MELYQKKSYWKLLLGCLAIFIILISLVFTNLVVSKIKQEEERKLQLWAGAIMEIDANESNPSMTYLSTVLISEKSIPVIITDTLGKIVQWNNLDPKKEEDQGFREKQLEIMKKQFDPIPIEAYGAKQLIYRKNSTLLNLITLFPYIQLGLIGMFVIFGYFTLSAARRSEQNRVWVGMAKETAHQLGTPISSLIGWVEHLKLTIGDQAEASDILAEFERDLGRLELIAERFSKIGSLPDMQLVNVLEILTNSFQYMERRAPKRVRFNYPESANGEVMASLNPPLFDWVIENLLKNALDALEGEGEISGVVFQDGEFTYIDISDTGKGIPANKIASVFKPGFTTKKRGWGLGLSLCKRIIEDYHSGKIFVKESGVQEGTTFRIQLSKL